MQSLCTDNEPDSIRQVGVVLCSRPVINTSAHKNLWRRLPALARVWLLCPPPPLTSALNRESIPKDRPRARRRRQTESSGLVFDLHNVLRVCVAAARREWLIEG